MKIIYPYNEILPKKKAHDVFIFHECAALSELGMDVTLAIGKGTYPQNLFAHYNTSASFKIYSLPLIRKNNFLNLSWNLPFFWKCQKLLQQQKPDWVIFSVVKQSCYHAKQRVPGVKYLYEVHELAYYPTQKPLDHFLAEKMMLERMDLITVTTQALKDILLAPPYTIKTRIEVVPLAVNILPLPPPQPSPQLQLAYVGQLYEGQGIPPLLEAMNQFPQVHLTICGGKPDEIAHFKTLSPSNVTYLGFIPPSHLREKLLHVHAFVAPFDNIGRMPYVAHTKLFEYAQWGRPLIAPNLPIVREHFTQGKGVLLFDESTPLADCINQLRNKDTLDRLQKEISWAQDLFTWQNRAKTYSQILNQN